MTGPINNNPFIGVSGTETIYEIQDRRKSLRFPEIDLSPVELSMNQGQDEDADIVIDSLDFDPNKKFPQ